MAERITWEQIDASPLLALPCEERARLREAGDERFRAFWDACYRTYAAKKPDTDGIAFSTTFIKVFTSYQLNPEKPGQTFSIYLRSAVKHAQAKSCAADTVPVSRFSRETNRKIKAALEYMADNGLDIGQVCNDPKLLDAAAAVASVSPKTLRTALQERQALLHMDDTEGAQAALPDAGQEDVALQVEHKQTLSLLHRGISLMNLRDKEDFGKRFCLLLSSKVLGVLRYEDKVPPTENAADRMAACDEFRPMEKDNCLWGVLLSREYVAFTIAPPYETGAYEELFHAALNPLLSPDRLPHQDKTVAEYCGFTKSAVSQRRNTLNKKLRDILESSIRSE